MNELPTDEEIEKLLSTPIGEDYLIPLTDEELLGEAILDSELKKNGFNVEELDFKIKEIILENCEELKIKEIIAKSAEVEIERVTLKKKLKENLGMDNVGKIQMAYQLAQEFKIEHFNETQFEFVRDIYLYVKKKILER